MDPANRQPFISYRVGPLSVSLVTRSLSAVKPTAFFTTRDRWGGGEVAEENKPLATQPTDTGTLPVFVHKLRVGFNFPPVLFCFV